MEAIYFVITIVVVLILCLILFPLAQKKQEDVATKKLKDAFIEEMKQHSISF